MRAQTLFRIAFLASVLSVPAFTAAVPLPLFPEPAPAKYFSTNTGFYPTPSGLVTLEGLVLSSPTGSIAPPTAPALAIWGPGTTFDAQTFMSFFGGGTLMSFNAGDAASASIRGLLDAPPVHTYSTEMLQLDLVGLPFGARIRESPTLASTGGHTIIETPLHIDSFFDVFTELSLDGGLSWTPATGPVHLVNPEPSSVLLLTGAAMFSLLRRQRAT